MFTVVVAGNMREVINWRREKGRPLTGRRDVVVTDWRDAEKMKGLVGPRRGGDNARLVLIGTWDQMPGLDRVRSMAMERGFDWPVG